MPDQATRNRLIIFQACDGLPADGVIGPATWDALKAVANSGTYLSCWQNMLAID